MTEVDTTRSQLSPRREPPAALAANTTRGRPPSVTIGLPVAEVYAFIRDFTNYPKFMRDLVEVEPVDGKIVRLTYQDAGGPHVGEIQKLDEVRDQSVSWKAVDDPAMNHLGVFSVEPAPGDRGTVVSLRMHFDGEVKGKVKGMIAYFTGRDPKNESFINLRRLKAYLETGEVPTILGQPNGRDQ